MKALCSDAFADVYLRPRAGEPGVDVELLPDLDAALAAGPGPLVVDEALLPRGHGHRAALLGRDGLVLVGDFDLAGSIHLLGAAPRLAHVLWRNEGLLRRQLRSTLAQLAAPRGWALPDYLAAGAPVETITVRGTDAKGECIDRVARAAAAAGGFSELAAAAATVASELVMNAIFNAPLDPATGQPKFRAHPRDAHLSLAPAEAVTLAFGADDGVFALAVEDQFGRFTRETLLQNLSRAARADHGQIRMRTPGAGVGLYMILNASSQVDIAVDKGRATRVVALFGLCKRFREFEAFGHSLNIFGKEHGG